MDLSPKNFVSIDEILSDVLKLVKDESTKLNSKGWYISQIQQALEELSFDTFFDKQNVSVEVPNDLRVEMPKGAFNLRDLYLFNGNNCVIEQSTPVYYKRNFINSNSGNGYVANDKWDNKGDYFHKDRIGNTPEGLHYFGLQNGLIMLSENCRNYERLMIVYNGIMTDIGEMPIVPQFFRQAVKDWVMVQSLQTKMADTIGTAEYSHWNNMLSKYDSSLNHPYDGSWIKAERRAKQLNQKERKDIKMYFQKMRY